MRSNFKVVVSKFEVEKVREVIQGEGFVQEELLVLVICGAYIIYCNKQRVVKYESRWSVRMRGWLVIGSVEFRSLMHFW